MRRIPVTEHLRGIRDVGLSEGKFARVPKSVILELRDAPGAFCLYALLMTYVSFDNSSSDCYPSIALLAKEFGVSESTVRRDIRELKKRGLVSAAKRGRRNVYELFSLVPSTGSSAQDPDRNCDENQSDLRGVQTRGSEGSAHQHEDSSSAEEDEREPRTRPIEEEVQACTSSLTRQRLKTLGFSDNRAASLIAEFGEEKAEAAIGYARGRDGVRNPAGLVIAYLDSNGWAKHGKLKEYLRQMQDPSEPGEEEQIARKFMRMCGSKPETLDALDAVQKDASRLMEYASNPVQKKIGLKLYVRAGEAMHYVRKNIDTPEEEAGLEELSRLLDAHDPL